MLSVKDTIAGLGGFARGSRLQQLGFTRQALSDQVRNGGILRLRAGVFAVAPVHPDVCTAAAHGGSLTCGSLLRMQGIWVLPADDGIHVWLSPHQHPIPHLGCSCTSHHFAGAPPLGPVSIELALLHLRRCAGDEAFFAAYESAWNLGMLSRGGRDRIRSALPRRARWLVDIARPDADSGLESLLRLRLHVLGLRLDCQVSIHEVGRVDFVVAGLIIIEADGKGNHTGDHRHRDLVRDAAASRLGYETLRFDYAQIIHDWPAVQAAILGALDRAGIRDRTDG